MCQDALSGQRVVPLTGDPQGIPTSTPDQYSTRSMGSWSMPKAWVGPVARGAAPPYMIRYMGPLYGPRKMHRTTLRGGK